MRRARKLLRLAADHRFRPGLRHGVAATDEHAGALAGRDFASVVDVGANRGQFALFAAGLWPHARIFAFEPLPEPYAVLARSAAGAPRIQAFRTAIGPCVASAWMHVMQPDDCSSLLAPTARQHATFPQTPTRRDRPGRDRAPGRLRGAGRPERPGPAQARRSGLRARRTGGLRIPARPLRGGVFECSIVPLYAGQPLAHDVLEQLRARGFRLVGIYYLAHDHEGRAVQADFWCERC